MKMTTKRINAIAAATKRICHKEGIGNQVVVFRDGSMLESTGSNDTIARGNGDGWEYPIARFAYPMTRAQVNESIRETT